MSESDLELAKTALRVLPENGPKEFERWYNSTEPDHAHGSTRDASSQSVVVNYNLDLDSHVELPTSLRQFDALINDYLQQSSSSDPWGMLNDEFVVLKLSDQPNSRSGRLLLFKMQFIANMFRRLFPDEHITPAEQVTVLQSLSGLTLKEAATLDGVSHETKRSHLKAVFQKTQINRQQILSSFLIAHLTLEVVASHSRKPTSRETDEQFFFYVDNYMGDYVRASVIQETQDKRYRLIEIGDPAGIPVVCIHHLGVLNFSTEEIEHIRLQGIRLICPLRQGAIGPMDERMSREQHIEHAIEGIDLAVSLIPAQRVNIVSMLSGCFYAMHYVQRYPEKISNLIMVSASYKSPESKRSLTGFKRNLHNLASRNKTMFAATVSFLTNRANNAEQLRKVWKESLNECDADYEHVDAVFEDPKQVAAMQHRLKHSPVSIIRDLQIQAEADWQPLDNTSVTLPVHFIHGDKDKVIPIETVREFVELRENTFLHSIEGAGNWAFGQHTNSVHKVIRSIAAND